MASSGSTGAGAAAFRNVMSRFPTGITVVTGMRDGTPIGMAANSFTSVSLDPPLVLFCAAHTSSTWPEIEETGAFAVNVLPEGSTELAQRFAQKGADRFAGVAYRNGSTGSPIMERALASIDCRIEEAHEAGDHVIVIGAVIDVQQRCTGDPLIFYRGGYWRLLRPGASAGPTARSHLKGVDQCKDRPA